jgi:uncharacterized membrane protein
VPPAPDDAFAEEFYADRDRRERERAGRRQHRRPTPDDPGHDHDHDHGQSRLRDAPAGRVLLGAVALLALFTVAGLIALWPGSAPGSKAGAALGGPTTQATVVSSRIADCGGPVKQDCRQIVVSVDGRDERITLGPLVARPADPSPGDHVRVTPVATPEGAPPPAERWSFVTIERRGALLWLVVALAVVAVVIVRLRGLLAVLGIFVSLAIVVEFIVPAMLAGKPALLVALVGSLAVMFVTLLLTHGLSAQTLAAALGIGSTLLATCVLAIVAVGLVHLDGHSSELTVFLSQENGAISLEGIVLAGMVIAALGVLTDTAVTQASAVAALRRADPRQSVVALYRGAFAVGRDHLSATVHTLVLAYAGTALPLLLVMRSSGVGFGDALNTQDVAEPVAAALVGCLALMAAVPITTGLAAFLVGRTPAAALGDGHGHAH